MAQYCYLNGEEILSDHFFDNLTKRIVDNWENIEHEHKYLLIRDGYDITCHDYPSVIENNIDELRRIYGK